MGEWNFFHLLFEQRQWRTNFSGERDGEINEMESSSRCLLLTLRIMVGLHSQRKMDWIEIGIESRSGIRGRRDEGAGWLEKTNGLGDGLVATWRCAGSWVMETHWLGSILELCIVSKHKVKFLLHTYLEKLFKLVPPLLVARGYPHSRMALLQLLRPWRAP